MVKNTTIAQRLQITVIQGLSEGCLFIIHGLNSCLFIKTYSIRVKNIKAWPNCLPIYSRCSIPRGKPLIKLTWNLLKFENELKNRPEQTQLCKVQTSVRSPIPLFNIFRPIDPALVHCGASTEWNEQKELKFHPMSPRIHSRIKDLSGFKLQDEQAQSKVSQIKDIPEGVISFLRLF